MRAVNTNVWKRMKERERERERETDAASVVIISAEIVGRVNGSR